jgi:hypothetical protein
LGWAGAAAVGLSAVAAAGVIGAYFVGYSPTTAPPPEPEARAVYTLAFFGNLFGTAAAVGWVAAGFAGLGVVAGAAVAAAAGAARVGGREWVRAAGLAAFLAAFVGFAVACGRHRVGIGGATDAFVSRYSTVALPAWWAVYLIAELYLPGAVGRVVRAGLLLTAIGVYAGNAPAGLGWARGYAAARAAYLRDLDAGFPSVRLAERYQKEPHGLCDGFPREIDRGQLLLRDAGVEPWARMAPNPPYRVETAAEAGGAFDADEMAYTLPAARRVYGVKFRWAYAALYTGATARVSWRTPGRPDPAGEAYLRVGYRTQFVWVDADVDRFRFELTDEPGGPRVKDLVLLVADPAGR